MTKSSHFSASLPSVAPCLSHPSAHGIRFVNDFLRCCQIGSETPYCQSVPLSVTHQSSANHLSHSMSLPAARHQACARPSSSRSVTQPVVPPAWSESERNNISVFSSPAHPLSNAFWCLVSPGWEQALVTTIVPWISFLWYTHSSRDYCINIIWQIVTPYLF